MRIQKALFILGISAIIMTAGLRFAEAQQNESAAQTARPSVRASTPARPSTRRNQQQAKAQAERERGSAASASGESGTQLRPFETGVEYRRISPRTRVTFNLEDADLPDLIRLISNMTGKRFILPGKVRSIKATVFAPTKVTVAEAYSAFLSILEVNGMTVVPTGRYLKIVETQGVEGEPLPVYGTSSRAPADARFITRLIRLENVTAEDVVQLISRFKSPEGSVTAYAPTNTLFITDTGQNIRRMQRVIREIDIANMGERVWIEPIHYAEASQLAERLQEIFPVGGAGSAAPAATPARTQRPRPPRPATSASSPSPNPTAQGPSTIGSSGASRITKILADERTNSLIIMATERAYLRILQMIRQLDVPLDGEGGIHVHYLQHGDAEEISTTLQSLIGGGGSSSSRSASGAARTKARPAQQRPAAAAGSIGNFQGDIRITAHKPSNALVVTASLHDYQTLRHVIERLDAPRRQVFIEAVIMELNTSSTRNLGLSFHGGVPDPAGDGSLSVFGLNAGQTSTYQSGIAGLLTGTAFGLFGEQLDEAQSLIGQSVPAFGVALQALSRSGDVDILSTPHLMAMDNTLAEISVGANIPLQTSGVGGLGGAAGGLGGLAGLAGAQGAGGAAGLAGLAGLSGGLGGALPRQDVGTTLRITPHINDDGQIRMEIEQEITSEGDRDGPNGAISINRRTAKTQVVVRDQETVVIGGQVRERTIASREGIPVLSDIPLIGALFRQTSTQQVRSNLLLFLTPYVIRDQTDLRRIFERKMEERQEFLDRYFVFGDHDYEPHVDYDRTSGLVMEIIQQVEEIEREEELNAAAAATPPPAHNPRPPVDGILELEEGDSVIEPENTSETDEAEPAAPAPTASGLDESATETPTAEAPSADTQSPRES